MNSRKFAVALTAIICLLSLQFCTKQQDSFTVQSYKDYYPLETGKYVIYRMDSTVFVDFDTKKEVRSYQAKDLVDAEITDNRNRKSYRIRRMVRNADGTGEWRDIATFMVTPLDHSLEYVENNNRYIKLQDPVKDNFFWDGNSYINAVDGLGYLQFWEYNYQSVGIRQAIGAFDFDNTITVSHVDEMTGDPEMFPNNFASKDYSIEVYAQDIGLVAKDYMIWTYQATPVTNNCRAVSATESIACPVFFNCDSLATVIGGQVRCDTIRIANAYNGYGLSLRYLEHN